MSRDLNRFPVPALNAVAQRAGRNPRVAVYLPCSSKTTIVCPTESVNGGLYCDQPPPALLQLDAAPESLGQSVWEALLSFCSISEPVNLRSYKKTDWPAFRASGMRSVRQFEDSFVRISIEAFPCTLRVEAYVLAQAAEDLFVGRHISNACQFEALGS